MIDIVAKTKSMKKELGCPRHGSEFMITDGGAVYCIAPTPGEISSKCFFHPRIYKKPRKKHKDKSKIVIPNVLQTLFKKKKKYVTKPRKKVDRVYNKSALQKMNKLMEINKQG